MKAFYRSMLLMSFMFASLSRNTLKTSSRLSILTLTCFLSEPQRSPALLITLRLLNSLTRSVSSFVPSHANAATKIETPTVTSYSIYKTTICYNKTKHLSSSE